MEQQVRAESPGVPPVAENVEVVTVPSEQELSKQTEGMSTSFKRAASSWERQRAKNPRLTEGLLSPYLSLSHTLSPLSIHHTVCIHTSHKMYMYSVYREEFIHLLVFVISAPLSS